MGSINGKIGDLIRDELRRQIIQEGVIPDWEYPSVSAPRIDWEGIGAVAIRNVAKMCRSGEIREIWELAEDG